MTFAACGGGGNDDSGNNPEGNPNNGPVEVPWLEIPASELKYLERPDGKIRIIEYTGKGGNLIIPSQIDGKTVAEFGLAFKDNTSLTGVIIPSTITGIVPNSFEGCSNLTSITIPASLKTIGGGNSNAFPFLGCTGLESITVDPDNPNYASEGGVVYNKEKTTLVLVPPGIKSVIVPSSVTSIPAATFRDTNNLESITIPFVGTSATATGTSAVFGMQFSSVNSSSSLKTVVITGGESIPNDAFEGCVGLTSITLPAGLKTIGSSAFEGCTSLTNITIPAGVTSIGSSSAFAGCTGLTSVTIPDSVTDSIGGWTFDGCTGLTSVTIGAGVTGIGTDAFAGCTGLASVTIGAGASIGDRAFADCTSLASVTFREADATWTRTPASPTYNHSFPGAASLWSSYNSAATYTRSGTPPIAETVLVEAVAPFCERRRNPS